MTHGYIRVASAVPSVRVADCRYNAAEIIRQTHEAADRGAAIVCFPELSITGYTCQDLFQQTLLLDEAEEAMEVILTESHRDVVVVVGMPIRHGGALLNAAVVAYNGNIMGVVAKTYLPNYKEFYEKRWFTSVTDVPEGMVEICGRELPLSQYRLFKTPDFTFGIELCEDLWAPVPPSSVLAMKGADIILNLSADNDTVGKYSYLRSLVSQQSARCLCGYVFSGCGFGESTQDIVFGGKAMIYENGRLLAASPRHSLEPQMTVSEVDIAQLRTERRTNTTFATNASLLRQVACPVTKIAAQAPAVERLERPINAHPFVPRGRMLDERCEEIFAIQTEGLAKRLQHIGCKSVVVGISGGLDSTLALLVCVRTYDRLGLSREGIVGVTMPGFGTTDRTYRNAMQLMEELGITIREVSIRKACEQHFEDIGHDMSVHNITYENGQARERTQILMDIANQTGGIVIGTGDLSELALGWATYNGDHMSMYGVNVSVPKTLVKHLVSWVAAGMEEGKARTTLLDIVDTPISPELIPADDEGNITQKTEDLVGPYELHDFFLYHVLRRGDRPEKIEWLAQQAFEAIYDADTIHRWLRTFCWRFFAQQFKRSCLPDGPKVGSCSLSPRGDWRMPSDASSAGWISALSSEEK